MLRIAIVADTYTPLRTSGAVQLRDLAEEMARQGHSPTAIVPSADVPFDWKIQSENGVRLLRVRSAPTKDISYVTRTLNELRLPRVLLRALHASAIGVSGWDAVVWYSPTIFLGPVVSAIRKTSRCPTYLILRDIFPEWAVDMDLLRRGPAYMFFKVIERYQYSLADTIGVQSPGNVSYLAKWAQDPRRRVEVLYNWLSESPNIGCSIDISKTRVAGRNILGYVGNMGVAQRLDVLLDVADAMRGRSDLGFVFVGRGSDANRLAHRAQTMNLPNVLFFDEIDPGEVPGFLSQCRVGIVCLDPRHRTHNVPGKFLAYMLAGVPVLASVNPGNDLEQIITQEGVGFVTTSSDVTTLKQLVSSMIADTARLATMAARARRVAKTLFSTERAVQQIVAAFTNRKAAGRARTAPSQ